MKITVNGENREYAKGQTLLELLAGAGLTPEATVAERNGEIVDREVYATTAIADGDTIELVQIVGGG